MELSGPFTYQIAWKSSREIPKVVESENGKPNFSNPVTLESKPKLYVISHEGEPVYVGKTTDPIATRLRNGFKPSPRYPYGYLWRHYLTEAKIDIWILALDRQDVSELEEDPSMKRAITNKNKKRIGEIIVETVEAEVVLLVQQRTRHWPKYQSEIHFHQSQQSHRDKAAEIINKYPKLRNGS